MNKDNLVIRIGTKQEIRPLLESYHYLSSISRGFKTGENYILLDGDEIVGACIFTGFPVPELSKGMFGLDRDDQDGLYELSRLVLTPDAQGKHHNPASWFVSRCIRMLRKRVKVRAILSYADNDFHGGTVYRALNFTYYGLTDAKKDFWTLESDGTYKKLSRGKTKGIEGEWRPRSRKHRYVTVYDKGLKAAMKWEICEFDDGRPKAIDQSHCVTNC